MPNNHRYYKKIRKEGGSRVMVVTNLLPPDWKMVKVVIEAIVDKGKKQWVRLLVEKVV